MAKRPEFLSVMEKLYMKRAYLIERECYRVFHDCLHMTPVEYIKAYRLQAACQMLAKGAEMKYFSYTLCITMIPVKKLCPRGSAFRNLEIKELFEEQIGCSIYTLLPGVVENSFC